MNEQLKEATDLIEYLLEELENEAPEFYSRSELVAKANDFLKEVDGE